MFSLFHPRTITGLLIAAASAFFLTACDRNPTDPPQPTTQGTERDGLPQPGTPIAPPPVEPATPGQPATPGGGTGTQ